MYSLVEYSNNYLKATEILWQYCRDEPPVDAANGNIVDFGQNNPTTTLFEIKLKITSKTGCNGTRDVEIMIPLTYFCNFWRAIEIPKCLLVVNDVINQEVPFSIDDTKHYSPVVTLSTEDKSKLLKQLICAFKRTLN